MKKGRSYNKSWKARKFARGNRLSPKANKKNFRRGLTRGYIKRGGIRA